MLQIKDDFLGRQMLHFSFHGPYYPLVVGVFTVSNGTMVSSFKTIYLVPQAQPGADPWVGRGGEGGGYRGL